MIEEKVFQCIREFSGGQEFFDKLDSLLRDDELFVSSLLKVAVHRPQWLDNGIKFNPLIILSGKFGIAYENMIKESEFDTLSLEGALRFNEIKYPEQYYEIINGRYCIFLDDSYFLGRTANKVKELVADMGGVYCGTFVGYDGSRILNPEVFSFFRYYDHFGG